MKEKINLLIEKYQNSEVYESIKNYYVTDTITSEEYNIILEKIKKVLVKYYLNKYQFKEYIDTRNKNSSLLIALSKYYNLAKKIKITNGKIKVYPVKLSVEESNINYINIIKQMVEYTIQTGVDFERTFDIFTKSIEKSLEKLHKDLNEKEMYPYFGTPSYIIGRSKYIIECIYNIPNIDIDVDLIIKKVEYFKEKYLLGIETSSREKSVFSDVNSQFYDDYDELEKCYKTLIEIEEQLYPIVIEHWKQYLTDPNNHNSQHFRYIMHTFSKGLVDPAVMTKACCSLNTDELIITPYGNCGLIYNIDVDSLNTLCVEDVGSWKCDKKQFIERGCPANWQLSNPNGISIWYEYERNSKLIMPNVFEKECKERNVSYNGEILNNTKSLNYSEIFLNENARPVGVFYTDECTNIEEVEAYAKKYNLPLINISLKKQRELKGMDPLPNYSK